MVKIGLKLNGAMIGSAEWPEVPRRDDNLILPEGPYQGFYRIVQVWWCQGAATLEITPLDAGYDARAGKAN